jgi:hypothetical protein
MHTAIPSPAPSKRAPWNKGRLTGQKRPLKPKDVWSIGVRPQLDRRKRNLALFNLAIDSKLRGCDLLCLQVDDVYAGGRVRDRSTVIQKKTERPVQFEITAQTRSSMHLGALKPNRGPFLAAGPRPTRAGYATAGMAAEAVARAAGGYGP